MDFRKAELRDIEVLIQTRLEFMNEVNGYPTRDPKADETLANELRAYFMKSMEDNSFVAWLALDEGKIVGTSGLSFFQRPPSYKNLTGKGAYIMNMYTKREYRGQGIASRLLEKLINEASSLGYKFILLNATDLGRSVYLRHGFRETNGEMSLYL